MNDVKRDEYLNKLACLRKETALDRNAFQTKYEEEVETYRTLISDGVRDAIKGLRAKVAAISLNNKTSEDLVKQTAEYYDWLQWTFWDLPYLAVAMAPPKERFRSRVAACGMVYLSARIFDDVIDRHFWYKGKRPTLLSIVSEAHDNSQGAEGLAILAGLLLCFEGLLCLNDSEGDHFGDKLRDVITSYQATVIGVIMEQSGREEWTPDYYSRLIYLKNVEYWHILYTAIDPGKNSALYPFLKRYYTLAQMLNDVQDYPEDERRNQPNLLSFYLPSAGSDPGPCLPIDSPGAQAAPKEVERILADEFLELECCADKLPVLDRLVARSKINESLEAVYRMGLFASTGDKSEKPAEDTDRTAPLQLDWHSELGEIIERVGPGVLEDVDCPVCRSTGRKSLFQKQGFSFHRCLECSHIYTSPRINSRLQIQIGHETDYADENDRFLRIQKFYAPFICQLVRSRAPGPRLLDIGFGWGYLMELSKSYGFSVYGIDTSPSQVKRLHSNFGKRVHQAAIGIDKIPWDSFDVVVMTHILEHLADPAAVLKEILEIMNPGGILYITVPDMDSVQFRIFGKNYDFINPLAHLQYFGEESLTRLLLDCGFQELERIQKPSFPEKTTPRWMALMRTFGGNDSGELDMVARCPKP